MKSKKPLSNIIFRISNDINPKTLKFINELFINGQLPKVFNDALKIYCDILSKKDILEYIRPLILSNKNMKTNVDGRRKPKKNNDLIILKLDKNVGPDELAVINEYYKNNKLSDLINTSLELYRVLSDLIHEEAELNNKDSKPSLSENETKKDKEINENTKLSYKLLKSFRRMW